MADAEVLYRNNESYMRYFTVCNAASINRYALTFSINADGSFMFRPKDLLLRQEASALLDLAFGYYALPIKRQ